MSLAGIQMLAPKPLRSLIGKWVVHVEILRILGRAALASAVVNAGWMTLTFGSISFGVPPAVRASIRAWICMAVASMSIL